MATLRMLVSMPTTSRLRQRTPRVHHRRSSDASMPSIRRPYRRVPPFRLLARPDGRGPRWGAPERAGGRSRGPGADLVLGQLPEGVGDAGGGGVDGAAVADGGAAEA